MTRKRLVGFRDGVAIYAPHKTAAQKLAELKPWQRHTGSPTFFATCRFCKRSVYEAGGMWQYSVRHYACDDCRDRIMQEAAS